MSDALTELEDLLTDLPAAVDQRNLGENLSKATASLSASAERIKHIVVLKDLAECLDYTSEQRREEKLKEVLEVAWEVGDDLQTADEADKLDKAIYGYQNKLQSELRSLDRDLRLRWDEIVSKQFRSLATIGDLLAGLLGESDLGSKMATCGREAINLKDSLPATDLLEAARRLLREYEELQSARKDELGDGDVAVFINALAEDQAVLQHVTEEVWAWLEENGSLNILKVAPL